MTGFADAEDAFLPMTVTLNAARILDLQAALLGVDHDGLAALARQAPPGAHGLTISPYYGGERTPNRPGATGVWSGLTGESDRADLARAAFEALACSLADAVDHLAEHVGQRGRDVLLVGGAARSRALREVVAGVFGQPITLPPPAEYVALGAARQAAWALAGTASPPSGPGPPARSWRFPRHRTCARRTHCCATGSAGGEAYGRPVGPIGGAQRFHARRRVPTVRTRTGGRRRAGD